ncbi:MAG: hypothetical protein ACPG5B_17115 [Chitinophagales bacterium]
MLDNQLLKHLKNKQANPKILFVCRGNTCRSAMAEALAKCFSKQKKVFESAGWAVNSLSANPKAVQTMWQNYDIDVSQHVPQQVSDIDLNMYEQIVVLDEMVFQKMKMQYSQLSLRLYALPDPFGGTDLDYQQCAKDLMFFIEGSF